MAKERHVVQEQLLLILVHLFYLNVSIANQVINAPNPPTSIRDYHVILDVIVLHVVLSARHVPMERRWPLLHQIHNQLALQLPVLNIISVLVARKQCARLANIQLLLVPQFVKIVPLVNTVLAVTHVMQYHACQEIDAFKELCTHAFLGSIHLDKFHHVKTALMENGLLLEVKAVAVIQLTVVKDTSATVGTEVHVEMENRVPKAQYTVISA